MANKYTINTASISDLAALTQISRDAWTKDRHTLMKARCAGYDHGAGMEGALTYWLSIPSRCTILKATDAQSKEIVGFVCWGYSGYDSEANPQVEDAAAYECETDTATEAEHDFESERNVESLPSELEVSSVERLAAITDQDMARWQNILSPKNVKVMFVIAISVSPANQSKGVGSLLIQWGTEKSDADQAKCWVHVSEGGYRAFARNGFKEVGRLEVDLDQFATALPEAGEGTADGRWGNYVFRYMVRLPKER